MHGMLCTFYKERNLNGGILLDIVRREFHNKERDHKMVGPELPVV